MAASSWLPVQSLAERAQLLSLPLHAHQIAASFAVYEALFLIVSPALSAYLVPDLYSSFSRRTKINWNVRVVSFIQASFISTLAISVIVTDYAGRQTGWEERLWGYTKSAGRVQAYAAGYFLWDLLISVQYVKLLGPGSLVHAICALTITMIGFKPFANYYGLRFVLYELSTPFLNIHWVLDKVNMTGSRLQVYNGVCLIATFFGCRLAWGFYQSFKLYSDAWSAWNSNSFDYEDCSNQQPMGVNNTSLLLDGAATHCGHPVPLSLLLLYLVGNTILSLLNCYWFEKMIAALRKRFSTSLKSKSS